jgi:hypothetical protein
VARGVALYQIPASATIENSNRLIACLRPMHLQRPALSAAQRSGRTCRALIEKFSDSAAYQLAEVHGARGEADAAFAWLNLAHAQRDGGLNALRTSPYLRSLRAGVRWRALMKKMGFEE